MILHDAEGFWLIVLQPDHARLAGDLARAWGAPPFAPPAPFAATVLAIAHHDDGWAGWEAAPRADPETWRPLSFLEVSIAEHVEIWRRSTALAFERDPHAGVLVSLHAVDLLGYRHSAPATTAGERAAIERFVGEQAARRAGILADRRADEGAIEAGFRLLQALDYLSLVLCGAFRPGTVGHLPGRDGPAAHAVAVAARGPLGAALRPWPFVSPSPLALAVPVRRIPVARYSDRSLRDAMAQARPLTETVTLEAGPG